MARWGAGTWGAKPTRKKPFAERPSRVADRAAVPTAAVPTSVTPEIVADGEHPRRDGEGRLLGVATVAGGRLARLTYARRLVPVLWSMEFKTP
jgi:hypothetical protein